MRSTIFFVGFLIALSGLLVQTQSQNSRQKSVLDRRRENDIIDIDSPFEGSGGLQGELSSGDVDPDAEEADEEEDEEDDEGEDEEEDEEEKEEIDDEFVDVDAEEDGLDEGESDVTKEEKEVAKKVPDLATDGEDDETESDGSGALLQPGSRFSSTSMASSSSITTSSTVSTPSTSMATTSTSIASSTKVASSTPVARSTRVATSTTTVASSTVALTHCQRLHAEESSRGGSRPPIGAFRPQCTPEGEFAERQCHASTGFCWCVERDGTEILGTRARSRPDCSTGAGVATSKAASSLSTVAPTLRRQPTTVRQRSSTTPTPTDDIILVDYTTPPLGVKAFNPTKDPTSDPFIDSGVDDSVEEGVVDPSNAVHLKSRTFLSTIRDPLIFAGIIGGAVLALLCIVLLVMFTIYRMRKKDEGTYPLDEPKRSAGGGVKYERAQQEYFA